MRIGNWSDTLVRLLGIRIVTIGAGQRGLLYREQRAVRVLQPGSTRLFGQHQPLDLRICDVANPVYVGRDAEQLIESEATSIRRAFVVIETEANETARISIGGRLVGVLAPGSRRLLWRTAVEPVVDRLPASESPSLPAAWPRSARQVDDADTAATRHAVAPHSTAPAAGDGWTLAGRDAGRPAFWLRARTLGVRIVAPRLSRAAASIPVIERQAA